MPDDTVLTSLAGVSVVRADDLLDLRFEFRNLGVRHAGSSPTLERVDPAVEAFVIVWFPPQSVGEAPSLGLEAEFPVASALSGATRLAFRLPPSVTSIPFSLGGLLDWTTLTPSLAANALAISDLPPDPAPVPAEPDPTATAIEAPYRLVLSPARSGRWATSSTAITRAGVTELWHARLVERLTGGPTDRILRPVWTPDLVEAAPVATALTAENRRTIVTLGGDLSQHGVPVPIAPRVLALSARGAWLDLDASWQIPDPPFPPVDGSVVSERIDQALKQLEISPPPDDELLELVDQIVTEFIPVGLSAAATLAMRRELLLSASQFDGRGAQFIEQLLAALPPRDAFAWSHRMLQGRDDGVRTVTPGFLLPWGHPVDLVQETRREFSSQVHQIFTAALVTRATVRVRDPFRSFTLDQYPNKGRETAFLSARLVGDLTRAVQPLDGPSTAVWLRAPDDGSGLMWTVVAKDRLLRPVTMSMELLFVAQQGADLDEALATYRNDPRSSVGLAGQEVTLVETVLGGSPAEVDAGARNAGSLVTHAVSFAGLPAAAAGGIGVLPMITEADVTVPAVNALLGTAGVQGRIPIRFDETYLRVGLDAVQNAPQVFARLRDEANGLDIASLPERAGGLLRPTMAIQGLSTLLGPVPDVDKVLAGVLDPASFIPDVKILGAYPLKTLVAPILSGLTAGDLGALTGLEPGALWDRLKDTDVTLPIPSLTTRKLGPVDAPTAVETRFVWKPRLDLSASLPAGLKLDPGARLVVLTTIGTPLDGSAPSLESRGELANFSLHFAGVVRVELASLVFTARNGRKLEMDASGIALHFEGPLGFVEQIRQFIPAEGLSDPPSVVVTPDGITAGYSLGLPTIGIGIFSLENVALSVGLELPFVDRPTRLRFALSTRHDPFLVTVSLFGGGGFFALTVDTQGSVGVEASIEFGGNFCLDLVVASGGVHVMAGIYFKMAGSVVELSGFLRAGGAVTVLGIITVTVEFYLALTYHREEGLEKVSGDATLTVGVEILFLHQDVTLHVHKEFANPVGDPTFEELVSPEDWTTYCSAFAA
jgi:hypothetical protein